MNILSRKITWGCLSWQKRPTRSWYVSFCSIFLLKDIDEDEAISHGGTHA